MSASVKLTWNGDPVREIVSNNMLKHAAETWHKLYTPFVPMDTGNLYSNVAFSAEGDSGVITHKAEYSPYVYQGDHMNFRRDKHPLASAHWNEAAISAGKRDELAAEVQNWLK